MLRNKLQRINQSHRIPPHRTSPSVLGLSRDGIRPTFGAAHVRRMAIKPVLWIVCVAGTGHKLIDYIRISLRKIITERIFRVERSSHINAVQPHLMRVNLFVPEAAIRIARLPFELAVKQIERFLILRILRLLINTEKDFTGVDTVETVIGQLISGNRPVFMYHCVCISDGVITNLLIAIRIIYIEHSPQFKSVTIVPFQFRLEIELPGFGATDHFRFSHPHRPGQFAVYLLSRHD